MTSLIITTPTPETEEADIVSSLFWPEISPAAVREDQRIDNTVTPARLSATLIEAIAATNYSMSAWRATQIQMGYATLADVPAEKINGVSILIHRYRRAVGCLAKALLLERYRDFDSTARGEKKSDQLTDPIDDHRRDHKYAIADITGRGRVTVELI